MRLVVRVRVFAGLLLAVGLGGCDSGLLLESARSVIDAGPGAHDPSSTATFAFHATGATTGFHCSLDAAWWTPCASPLTLTGLRNGAHSLAIAALDSKGVREPAPPLRAWTVEATGPETVIDSGPADATSATTAVFAFHAASARARFNCSLDGGSFVPCVSPTGYPGLVDGAHRFAVTAEDDVGNVGTTPATRQWLIDTRAPSATIDSGPLALTRETGAAFTFHATEMGATFHCALDFARSAPCTSPARYSELTDGPHRFTVVAIDSLGNADPRPAVVEWAVDTSTPDTFIDSGPRGATGETVAVFTFYASQVGCTFRCAVDGAALAPCSSPASVRGLAPGPHHFVVTATSRAGNSDPSPATRDWSIDATPPQTLITAGPAAMHPSARATFTFSADKPGSTFRCALDGAAAVPCASPYERSGLSEGFHWFSVSASDAQGNEDPTPATWFFTVDAIAPDTVFIATPAAVTPSGNATFSFVATESGASFRCSTDGAAPTPCAPPVSLAGLLPGDHTFSVAAVDAAGNLDPVPATFRWKVGAVALSVGVLLQAGPAPRSRESQATFVFQATQPGATFACRLDGGAAVACVSPLTYPALGEGAHTFSVVASLPGVPTSAPLGWAWSIDTVAPTTQLTNKPSNPSTSRISSFSFIADEPGTTFRCRLDLGPLTPCTSPLVTPSLDDGSHTLAVIATDPSGNVEPVPALYTWVIDATPPDTTLLTKPALIAVDGDPKFSVRREPGLTYQCALDGGPLGPCPWESVFACVSTGLSRQSCDAETIFLEMTRCIAAGESQETCGALVRYSGLASGTHTFVVVARDAAGNDDPTPATWTWRVYRPFLQVATLNAQTVNGWMWASGAGNKLYLASANNTDQRPFFKAYDVRANTFHDQALWQGFCACGYNAPLVSVNDKLFLFANEAGVYDPSTDTWNGHLSYPRPNGEFGTAALGNVIYQVGGRNSDRGVSTYDTSTDRWGTAADYPFPAQGQNLTLVASGGQLYGVGYQTSTGRGAKMARYNPAANRWTELPDAPFYPQWNAMAPRGAGFQGKLYFSGDGSTPGSSGLHVYDTATGVWDGQTATLPYPDEGAGNLAKELSPVVVANELYLVGTYYYSATPHITIWKFLPL